MTNAKARLHLVLDERLKKRIQQIADAEHRTTTRQVEHLLELGVRNWNRQSREALGDSEQDGIIR